MKTRFEDLKLDGNIISGLQKQQITAPTPIQALVYPAFLEGKNLIVESHTGSGKTLAFLLPLFKKIDLSVKGNQAIILAPTHELAHQINEQVKLLAQNSGINVRSQLIMGEVNIENQIKRLKDKPEIIIGSAGRILDLISKKKITTSTIQTVILDEADNLLLHNQSATVKKLLHTLNESCQIALFSASMGEHIEELSLPLLVDPVILRTADQTALNPMISHYYVTCDQRDKFETLKKLLQTTKVQRALVFVSQHTDTKVLVEKLNYHGFTVATISGKLGKEERKHALASFRSGKVSILLSSDLSARGLDVPHISHIIHYDLPLTPEDYLHRSGRTARNGNEGTSICMMTPKDLGMLRILERRFEIKLSELAFTKGRLRDLATGDFLAEAPLLSLALPKEKKSRNKYPKGFNSEKGASKKEKAPLSKKKKQKINSKVEPTASLIPENGTLADALKLIEEAGFID